MILHPVSEWFKIHTNGQVASMGYLFTDLGGGLPVSFTLFLVCVAVCCCFNQPFWGAWI